MSGRAESYRKQMTESQMLKALRDFVAAEGGLLWHVRDARRQELVGLPDVICVLPQRRYAPAQVAFIELKTQRDTLSPEQRKSLFLLDRATEVIATVLRPIPKEAMIELGLDDVLLMLGKRDG